MSPSVSVVIPTLNAEEEIAPLLDALLCQTLRPHEIIVVDSSSADGTPSVVERYVDEGVQLHTIARQDFDHGGTRHFAFELTKGSIVVFLTQDAVPANDALIDRLVSPLSDERVGMAYGRQLPRKGARRYEALTREFNYPPASHVRTSADIERMGIKAFFASDSCAAYRRDAYIACGGFERPCATNEDMFMAAKMLRQGYAVAYVAEAQVFHSHDLTFMQQFKRTRASMREMKKYSSLIGGASSTTTEGFRMMSYVSRLLLSEQHYSELFSFFIDCMARFFGSRLG